MSGNLMHEVGQHVRDDADGGDGCEITLTALRHVRWVRQSNAMATRVKT